MSNTETQAATDITLTIERVFDAPRALVFKMWTEASHMSRWCCPTGFTIQKCTAELKIGGSYSTVMESPHNTTHHVSGVYTEIEHDSRLAFTHGWVDPEGQRGHESLVTITFVEEGGKTRLTLTQSSMESETSRDMHRSGWSESLDNLAPHISSVYGPKPMVSDFLLTAPADRPASIITRSFAAPVTLVWKAITDPAHLAQWWGPHGYTNQILEMDVRPGGKWRIDHRAPDGTQYDFHGEYLEVEEPTRLVQTFTMEGEWAEKPLTEIYTLEERDGRTYLHNEMLYDTPEERDAMLKTGMEWGARQCMDRLEILARDLR
jgi:uncharacterized protein YndB with AHSA1/START domain